MNIRAELLEKVKKANGPDETLDQEISTELDQWWEAWPDSGKNAYFPYTQSVDASLDLLSRVLPGWFLYRIDSWHNYDHDEGGAVNAGYGVHLWRRMKNKDGAYDAVHVGWIGSTIPLAIIAAILTALEKAK